MMPQTKFQHIVFGLMMVFAMVYAMVCYNMALAQGGLSNAILLGALAEVPLMILIAFTLETLIVGRVAKKLAFRMVTPGKDSPILVTLAISCMTVCLMCPSMSLISTLLFKHAGVEFVSVWLQSMAISFPMALCWQVFFAGPAVRFVFRTLFRRSLSAAEHPHVVELRTDADAA